MKQLVVAAHRSRVTLESIGKERRTRWEPDNANDAVIVDFSRSAEFSKVQRGLERTFSKLCYRQALVLDYESRSNLSVVHNNRNSWL